MDFLLKGVKHDSHDEMWTLFSSHYKCAVCIGCMVEIMENDQMIPLQKKPALTELLRLLKHQSSDIMEIFMTEEMVVWHLLTVLLDNMQIEDDLVQTICTEGILRLSSLIGSEDLVTSIIDFIIKKMESVRDHNKIGPCFMLIGKLLYQLPGLVNKMILDYSCMVDQLGEDMRVCGEKVQSELAYIFILIVPSYTLMTPRLTQNIHAGTLSLLVTARKQDAQINGLVFLCPCIKRLWSYIHAGTLSLLVTALKQDAQINGLGLLRKLIDNDRGCHALMSIKKDDNTILSALKRLLLSKQPVLQIHVAQVLLQLLTKTDGHLYGQAVLDSDIAEFLFEGLHSSNMEQILCIMKVLKQLADLEYFYKRYHAVYGIESIIRCLITAEELNNQNLQQDGFELMNEILKRQPADIPLFVSQNVVKNCLRTIYTGIQKKHISVSLSAQKTLAVVLRTDYLLTPIPFIEISQCITSVGEMLQEMDNKQTSTRHNKNKLRGQPSNMDDVLNNVCDITSKAANLVIECKTDPTLCESTYLPPSIDEDKKSKLDVFIEDLFLLLDGTFIPVVVVGWNEIKTPDIYWKFTQLFNLLHRLDANKSCDLVNKLVQAGFLGNLVDVTAQYRESLPLQYASGVTKFLQLAVECYKDTDKIGFCSQKLQLISHEHLKWKLGDLSNGFLHGDVKDEEIWFYLTILYISYRHGNRLICNEELISVLCSIVEIHTSLEQLPPLSRRQYLFLLAWLSTNSDFDMWKTMLAGLRSLPTILNEDLDTWYTDNIILLLWCYSDQILAPVSGQKMLSVYLEFTTVEKFDEILNDLVESSSISQLFDSKHFTRDTTVLLANSSEDVIQKLSCLHEQMIEYFLMLDCKPDPSLVDGLCGEDDYRLGRLGDMSKITEQTLLDVFLKGFTDSKNHIIQALLELYMKVYRYSSSGKTFNKKVLFHVLNQIQVEGIHGRELNHVFLVAVLASLSNKSDIQAVSMILKYEKFIAYLEACLSDTSHLSFAIGCDILTDLITLSHGVQEQIPISVNLPTLTISLFGPSRDSTCLSLLAAIFDKNLSSNIMKVEGNLDLRFYKSLLLSLQQVIVQEHEEGLAVGCFVSVMSHLSSYDEKIYDMLLYQPWTRLMLDVLIDTAMETGLHQHHLTLFNFYTRDKHRTEVINLVPECIKRLIVLVSRDVSTSSENNGATHTQTLISQILSNCQECLLPREIEKLRNLMKN